MGVNESKEVPAKILKDYRSMLSSTGSCSFRRTDGAGRAEQGIVDCIRKMGASQENKLCSERCKATMRMITEQVQAETEQWSQVQETLQHVIEEMVVLRKSREFWKDLALHADEKVETLQMLVHDWKGKALLSEIKISELQLQAAQLRNEIELVRHRQTGWLGASRRHTGELLSTNSGRSLIGVDTHLDSLAHHNASVSAAKMSNQSANREKAAHPNENKGNEKHNTETEYMPWINPRISKAVQKSDKCSQNNSIKYASELCELHSNHQSSSMRLQPNDCVTEKLLQKRTKKKIRPVHSKENFPLPNKHGNREIKKLNQPKRNQDEGSMGYGKLSTMVSLR